MDTTTHLTPTRRSLVATAVSVTALSLALTAGAAFGADGNAGTVKVHDASTDGQYVNNEPKVCQFYLGFYFADPAQTGSWEILAWDGSSAQVASGTYDTNGDGFDQTVVMGLPDGHYRVNWQGTNDTTQKHKMFWVDCSTNAVDEPGGDGGELDGGGQPGGDGGELGDAAMPLPLDGGSLPGIGLILVGTAGVIVAGRRLREML